MVQGVDDEQMAAEESDAEENTNEFNDARESSDEDILSKRDTPRLSGGTTQTLQAEDEEMGNADRADIVSEDDISAIMYVAILSCIIQSKLTSSLIRSAPKKRGRPRKSLTSETHGEPVPHKRPRLESFGNDTLDIEAQLAHEANAAYNNMQDDEEEEYDDEPPLMVTSPPKRGRGRPRKQPVPEADDGEQNEEYKPPAKTPTGRPRGRPRKEADLPHNEKEYTPRSATRSAAPTTTGKPRDRPRKNPVPLPLPQSEGSNVLVGAPPHMALPTAAPKVPTRRRMLSRTSMTPSNDDDNDDNEASPAPAPSHSLLSGGIHGTKSGQAVSALAVASVVGQTKPQAEGRGEEGGEQGQEQPKRRGRPRKADGELMHPRKEILAPGNEQGQQEPPKKRGRPRKADHELLHPRKDPSASSAALALAQSHTEEQEEQVEQQQAKKRGRPMKANLREEAGEGEAEVALEVTKSRGRPRKELGFTLREGEVEAKRPRGRPRKVPTIDPANIVETPRMRHQRDSNRRLKSPSLTPGVSDTTTTTHEAAGPRVEREADREEKRPRGRPRKVDTAHLQPRERPSTMANQLSEENILLSPRSARRQLHQQQVLEAYLQQERLLVQQEVEEEARFARQNEDFEESDDSLTEQLMAGEEERDELYELFAYQKPPPEEDEEWGTARQRKKASVDLDTGRFAAEVAEEGSNEEEREDDEEEDELASPPTVRPTRATGDLMGAEQRGKGTAKRGRGRARKDAVRVKVEEAVPPTQPAPVRGRIVPTRGGGVTATAKRGRGRPRKAVDEE